MSHAHRFMKYVNGRQCTRHRHLLRIYNTKHPKITLKLKAKRLSYHTHTENPRKIYKKWGGSPRRVSCQKKSDCLRTRAKRSHTTILILLMKHNAVVPGGVGIRWTLEGNCGRVNHVCKMVWKNPQMWAARGSPRERQRVRNRWHKWSIPFKTLCELF